MILRGFLSYLKRYMTRYKNGSKRYCSSYVRVLPLYLFTSHICLKGAYLRDTYSDLTAEGSIADEYIYIYDSNIVIM